MKFTQVVLALLLLIPIVSFADIVKWVDENGRVYYSDKVPEKYRDRAEIIDISHANFIKNDNANTNAQQFEKIQENQATQANEESHAEEKLTDEQQEVASESEQGPPPQKKAHPENPQENLPETVEQPIEENTNTDPCANLATLAMQKNCRQNR